MLYKRACTSPRKNKARRHRYIVAKLHLNQVFAWTDIMNSEPRCEIRTQNRFKMFTSKRHNVPKSFVPRRSQKTEERQSKTFFSKPFTRSLPTSCFQTPRSSQKHSKRTQMSSELCAATKISKFERRAAKKSSARRRSTKLPPPRIKTLAACLSFST